jgi:hypothetical protein
MRRFMRRSAHPGHLRPKTKTLILSLLIHGIYPTLFE